MSSINEESQKFNGSEGDAKTFDVMDVSEKIIGNESHKLLEEFAHQTGVVKEVKYQKGVQKFVKEVDAFCSWLVVFFSFLSCFVVGVLFIAFSLLYLEFVENFEAERSTVGWIGSMYFAVGNLFGAPFILFQINLIICILILIHCHHRGCVECGDPVLWVQSIRSARFIDLDFCFRIECFCAQHYLSLFHLWHSWRSVIKLLLYSFYFFFHFIIYF